MARRFSALLGFFAVLALAVLLLYRVYLHHQQSEPYDLDEGAVVRMDVPASTLVKITHHLG